MNDTKPDYEKAVDAVDVLNDLIGDIVSGTNIFRDYRKRLRSGEFTVLQMTIVQKICFSHLALSLCKLLEFWEHYHQLVPEMHRDVLKKLNTNIRNRGVKQFRNKVAGHIWDRKLQRPLRQSEVMEMLKSLIGSQFDDFLNWMNDAEDENKYPETVLSIIEAIRDEIARAYGIEKSEILER